jgi:DNA polymerase IV
MSRWPRQILFGDIDAMFASSAIVADPSLADKLVAIGSPPPRGIITSASYPARRFGVKAAMPSGEALRLCPNLLIVPSDHDLYRRMHRRLQDVTNALFPQAVWCSIDEFYADTTDMQSLYPDPAHLAHRAKEAIREATGLVCTMAVAPTKIVAKVAADCHKPDGLVVIGPGSEQEFLAVRPVRALPGIGPRTAGALESRGLKIIGDLLDPRWTSTLRELWGPRLTSIQARAQGQDHDPVVADHDAKSRGHETTFDHDSDDLAFFKETLYGFLTSLTHDLRSEDLAAAQFTVKLKDAAFRISTRQRHFPHPLNYDPAMWPAIQSALETLLIPRKPYRLIGLSLSGLVPAPPSLFDRRTEQAMAAMDRIIDRHGAHVIRIGALPSR